MFIKSINTYQSSYKVLKEHRLVIETSKGILSLDGLKSFKMQQSRDEEFDPSFDLICDYREIKFDGPVSKVADYVSFMKQNEPFISEKRNVVALIDNNSHHLLYTSEFHANSSNKLQQKFSICFSLQEALNKLNKEIDCSAVQQIIGELYLQPKFVYEF